MVDLLSKVLQQTLSPEEALDSWPNIDCPSDSRLMRNAWHALSHYYTDEDIRINDPGYDKHQRMALVAILEELRKEGG